MRNKLATLVTRVPSCNISKGQEKNNFQSGILYLYELSNLMRIKSFQLYTDSESLHSDISYENFRTSLVAKWVRIYLPIERTGVGSLVWEDSTCWRAMKPVCHNYWSPCAQRLFSTREATAMRSLLHCREEEPPLNTTRENPHKATKTGAAKRK